jgi:hypothetical protein
MDIPLDRRQAAERQAVEVRTVGVLYLVDSDARKLKGKGK